MIKSYYPGLVCLLYCTGALTFTSCKEKDDPQLKVQLVEQDLIIKEKEEELRKLRSEFSNNKISDPSEEIATIEEKINNLDAEIEIIQNNIETLSKQKRDADNEYDAYRRKYPLRD